MFGVSVTTLAASLLSDRADHRAQWRGRPRPVNLEILGPQRCSNSVTRRGTNIARWCLWGVFGSVWSTRWLVSVGGVAVRWTAWRAVQGVIGGVLFTTSHRVREVAQVRWGCKGAVTW